MTEGTMGVLIGPGLDVAVQLGWAVQLAEARKLDLLVLQVVEGRENQTLEIALDESPQGQTAPLVLEVLRSIESSPILSAATREVHADENGRHDGEFIIHVRLKQMRCTNLRSVREQLLSAVRKSKLKLITLARTEIQTTDPDLTRERRLFLRYVPCEVVYCFGLDEDNDLGRILVAVASGPHADAALRLGRDLAAEPGEKLTAVRVNPRIGPDAVQVGARRIESRIKKALGKDVVEINRRVVVDDDIHSGIRRIWEEGSYDLVVLGASRTGLLGGQISGGVGARVFKGETRPAVAIVSSGSPIRNRLVSLTEGAIERLVPQIDREDRISLVDRIQSSSNWDVDFFALMLLSTVIAAIGLIQNSAAVVIGAMLVAPLMTPLLGLGLALVQGNPVLARISFRAIVMGLGVSLLVAFLVGLATPGFHEPTREMLGRGGPSVLDLVVAFASGLAAAYASSRPGLLAALPGVAIAAALVPPIATSGLALSIGNFDLAFNALLLFTINMVTIVLASMTSLWVVGIRNIKRVSRWTSGAAAGLMIAAMILGVYLSVEPKLAAPASKIPRGLMTTIQERLGNEYRLDGIALAYDELGAQLNVRISGTHLAPEEVADDIRALARKHLSRPVRVRLVTQVEAGP